MAGGGAGLGAGGGLGNRTGPCTGMECTRIPCSLRSRYPNMGSIPKLNSSMANLSPCLIDCLIFLIHLPGVLLTTTIDRLSSYRFLYRLITSSHSPFLARTMKHQVQTILQNAAIRSVSRMPHLVLFLPAMWMASRAIATPWEILFSPPVTSWRGEMVLDMVDLTLAASTPVINLKSTFRRESFLLSEMRRLLAFFPGLFPNTISEVLWLAVGFLPLKTSPITCVSGSPRICQYFWYR